MAQLQTVGRVATRISIAPFEHGDDTHRWVEYHNTKVVSWNDTEIILDTGGYFTATTKTRMNQASNQFNLGYRVYQKRFNWFVEHNNQVYEFTDNKVTLER